ncbi:MAG: hypothetical protein KKB70_04710, partial [Proteobacteria bacterium]|nr:hypothetical protein [Pseudomonadota bacterium]
MKIDSISVEKVKGCLLNPQWLEGVDSFSQTLLDPLILIGGDKGKKESDEPDRPLTTQLALQLWKHPGRTHKNSRRLLVADPFACMVTLVWQANAETVKEDFLEPFVHRYFQFLRLHDRTLAHRPGLQLVVLAEDTRPVPDEEKDTFYSSVQQLLRRMGEAALDLQFRWIEETADKQDDLLKMILSAHGQHLFPAANHTDAGQTNRMSLGVDLEHEKKQLKTHLAQFSEGSPSNLDLFVRHLQFSSSQLSRDASPKGKVILPPESPALMLGAFIQARRYVHTPLRIDTAPVTLIASENASGKTTLIECLSQLFLDRPRLRAVLPDDATTFINSEQSTDSHNQPMPSPQLRVHRLTRAPESPLGHTQFLPLFADDAELNMGRPGETAVLTVIPHLESADVKHLFEYFKKLAELQERIHSFSAAFRTIDYWQEVIGLAELPDPRTGSRELADLWHEFLDAEMVEISKPKLEKRPERPHGKDGTQPSAPIEAGASDAPQPDTSKGDPAETEPQDASKDPAQNELEELINSIPALTPPSEDATAPSTLSADELERLENAKGNLFLRWLMTNPKLSSVWPNLMPHLESPNSEFLRQIIGLIADYLNAKENMLSHQARAFAQNLERRVHPMGFPEDKETDVEHFLDIGIELPGKQRPNTARQVRKAFAVRLSRWLDALGGELPILLV